MEIRLSFPGGKRVDAQFGEYSVRTDQPVALGGNGSAPAPFDLFLASLTTCAGIYLLGFCQARGISTEGLEVVQHDEIDPQTKLPASIRIDVRFPRDFPEKYRAAALRAAEGCKVKKTMAALPEIRVVAVEESKRVDAMSTVSNPGVA